MNIKFHKIIYKGKTLKEWANENGIQMNTVRNRIKKGWVLEKALFEPPHNKESKRFVK